MVKCFQTLFIASVFAAAFALPANANDAENTARAAKIIKAFKVWVKDAKATSASISVSYLGEPVANDGVNRSPADPYPVASLAKAITGACVGNLVKGGKLTYDTNLREIAPDLDVDVKISSLLNHSSGFTTDVTQSSLRWIKDRSKENLELVSKREVRKGSRDKEGSLFRYNNSNYAMLGLAISKLTGKTYADACNDLVLKPLGIKTATLNPDWTVMSSWGGWKISANDYLKFVDHHFTADGFMGESPIKLAHRAFPDGANYGLGFLFRKNKPTGFHYWHTGAWDWRGKPKREKFSAFFAKWANGWAVSVNADTFPGWELMGELDQGLWNASWR